MALNEQRIDRRTILRAGGLVALGFASAGTLAACANSDGSKSTGSTAATPVSLAWSVETGPGKDYAAVVAAFNKANPNLQVELTQIDPAAAGPQWPRIAIQNGKADLVANESPKFMFLDPLLKGGLLEDLSSYSTKYKWNEALLPEAIKRSSRDGALWTVPLFYEACGIAYRKSTLTKAGITQEPKTWDEFVAALTTLKSAGLIPLTVGHRGFSQVMMLHNQLWAGAAGPQGIEGVLFGTGKWTDPAPVATAEAIVKLYTQGLIDKDATSITQDDAAERFLSGKAGMHVTGTWFFSEMVTKFGVDDWGFFSAPAQNGSSVWALGETEAMVIPKGESEADQAAQILDYCINGEGAKILRERGNLLATTKYSDLAIPQVKKLPIITKEPSAPLIFGWLPQSTQDAWQQGLGGMMTGNISVQDLMSNIQTAWDANIANGDVPANRATVGA